MEMLGKVTRYLLALVAGFFFLFFLVEVDSPHVQTREDAGRNFAYAIIYGAVASWWFYSAKKKSKIVSSYAAPPATPEGTLSIPSAEKPEEGEGLNTARAIYMALSGSVAQDPAQRARLRTLAALHNVEANYTPEEIDSDLAAYREAATSARVLEMARYFADAMGEQWEKAAAYGVLKPLTEAYRQRSWDSPAGGRSNPTSQERVAEEIAENVAVVFSPTRLTDLFEGQPYRTDGAWAMPSRYGTRSEISP